MIYRIKISKISSVKVQQLKDLYGDDDTTKNDDDDDEETISTQLTQHANLTTNIAVASASPTSISLPQYFE